MFEVVRTGEFIAWLTELTDIQDRARIAKRLDRLIDGSFGDAKPVGGGVSELRFAFGPGYRVYYMVRGRMVATGGDKRTQRRDIDRAIALAKEV
jgi:putative addiction module killer protein